MGRWFLGWVDGYGVVQLFFGLDEWFLGWMVGLWDRLLIFRFLGWVAVFWIDGWF